MSLTTAVYLRLTEREVGI